jgi:pimeloyl-ACP methyl ester carboxylesterase
MPIELSFPSPHAAAQGGANKTRECLVYFLTGNPGIIDYYEPFLRYLRARLDAIEATRAHSVAFHIHGRNLAGFDDNDHEQPFSTRRNNPPHDVEHQLQACARHLAAANAIPEGRPRAGQPFDDVVLVGHSLGTYLTLELFHRHMHDPSTFGHGKGLNLRSGVLLFATVAHLAKSPKGLQLDLLRRIPALGAYVPAIAGRAASLLPQALLRFVTSRLLGMDPHAADTTVRFLASRDGVRQALYLGMDELAVISEEAWAEELWEIGDEAVAHGTDVPKFYIFFGNNDHWVANRYRDEFIGRREEHAARQDAPKHKRGRTRIEIDEGDLPHDFCISKYIPSPPPPFFFLFFSTSSDTVPTNHHPIPRGHMDTVRPGY